MLKFSLSLACSLLTLTTGCGREEASSPTVPPPTEMAQAPNLGPEPHDFGEFSFMIPDGWTVVAPDRDKTRAMLVLQEADEVKAMLKVDVGSPTAPTPGALARQFAQSTGGKVLPQQVDFDGVPGVGVMTASKTMETPKNVVLLFRNEQVYSVMVAAVEGADVLSAMTTIRYSWKWKDMPAETSADTSTPAGSPAD